MVIYANYYQKNILAMKVLSLRIKKILRIMEDRFEGKVVFSYFKQHSCKETFLGALTELGIDYNILDGETITEECHHDLSPIIQKSESIIVMSHDDYNLIKLLGKEDYEEAMIFMVYESPA